MAKRFSFKNIVGSIYETIKETITGKTVIDNREFATKDIRKRNKIIRKLERQFQKQLIKESKMPYYVSGEKVSTVGERRIAKRKYKQEAGLPKREIPKYIKSPEQLITQIERLEQRLDTGYNEYKAEIWRENFLKSGKKVFGADEENFQTIVDLVNEIDTETIYNALKQYDELQINYVYNESEYENKLNEVISTLQGIAESNPNMENKYQYDINLKIK